MAVNTIYNGATLLQFGASFAPSYKESMDTRLRVDSFDAFSDPDYTMYVYDGMPLYNRANKQQYTVTRIAEAVTFSASATTEDAKLAELIAAGWAFIQISGQTDSLTQVAVLAGRGIAVDASTNADGAIEYTVRTLLGTGLTTTSKTTYYVDGAELNADGIFKTVAEVDESKTETTYYKVTFSEGTPTLTPIASDDETLTEDMKAGATLITSTEITSKSEEYITLDSSVYSAKGSTSVANLNATTPSAGDVYDITEAFAITSEGKIVSVADAGENDTIYPAYTNVVYTVDGEFDALGGMFDMSKWQKVLTAGAGIEIDETDVDAPVIKVKIDTTSASPIKLSASEDGLSATLHYGDGLRVASPDTIVIADGVDASTISSDDLQHLSVATDGKTTKIDDTGNVAVKIRDNEDNALKVDEDGMYVDTSAINNALTWTILCGE